MNPHLQQLPQYFAPLFPAAGSKTSSASFPQFVVPAANLPPAPSTAVSTAMHNQQQQAPTFFHYYDPATSMMMDLTQPAFTFDSTQYILQQQLNAHMQRYQLQVQQQQQFYAQPLVMSTPQQQQQPRKRPAIVHRDPLPPPQAPQAAPPPPAASYTVDIYSWPYSSQQVGDYDLPARLVRLERYQAKRRELKFRRVRYAARSEICLQRKRVGGRFVTSTEEDRFKREKLRAAAEEEEEEDSNPTNASDEEVSLILQSMKQQQQQQHHATQVKV